MLILKAVIVTQWDQTKCHYTMDKLGQTATVRSWEPSSPMENSRQIFLGTQQIEPLSHPQNFPWDFLLGRMGSNYLQYVLYVLVCP